MASLSNSIPWPVRQETETRGDGREERGEGSGARSILLNTSRRFFVENSARKFSSAGGVGYEGPRTCKVKLARSWVCRRRRGPFTSICYLPYRTPDGCMRDIDE